MSGERTVSPVEAFSILASDVRIEILRSFLRADRSGESTLCFMEVYERLPLQSTSQLAYHLGKLDGVFLYRTGEGYALTPAGERIVRAILSGTYTERFTFQPIRLEGRCPTCEATTLRAERRELELAVVCEGCERSFITYDVHPAEVADRASFEILQSCDRRVHQEYATAFAGTCSLCGGRTDIEIGETAEERIANWYVGAECRQCYYRIRAPLPVPLLSHPAVVAFYWGRDVDISAVPFWMIHEYLDDWTIEVVDTDPFSASVEVRYAGDLLMFSLDEGLTVANSSTATVDEWAEGPAETQTARHRTERQESSSNNADKL